MINFPDTPTVNQIFQQWLWDGTKWVSANLQTSSLPACGLLSLVGASPSQSVQLLPYKGDLLKLNGKIVSIPAAGLSAAANSARINGTVGSLAASTLYYVYVYDTGSGLSLDFSATGHEMSPTAGNVGVERKIGDDTRSFVGLVRTSATAPASNSFYDDLTTRYVRSWFNRKSVGLAIVGSNGSFSAGAPSKITSFFFAAFAGETIKVDQTYADQIVSGTAGADGYIFVDGVQQNTVVITVNSGAAAAFSLTQAYKMTEGAHEVGHYFAVSGGTHSISTLMSGWLG